jgi:hypothetical protein
MTWDPETDDPAAIRRRLDREQADAPSDYGADAARDFGDEPPPAWRDAPPPPLTPIDPNAPVSGHHAPAEHDVPITEAPEHDWGHAETLVFPTFRPVGTHGIPIDEVHAESLASTTGRGHATPIVDDGPAGLPVVYSLNAGGFDILVNPEHLLSWHIGPAELQSAALANLARWSASAPWTDEVSGDRRLMSSDTGEGWDAVRILLPEVREHLQRELGPSGRVLVGVPERHLLVAGALRPDDTEFATMFATFVAEQADGSDEPVDRRVFELVDGRLVELATPAA